MKRDTAFQESFDRLIFDFGLTRKILIVFVVVDLFLKLVFRLNLPWLVFTMLITWLVLYFFAWPRIARRAKNIDQLQNFYFFVNIVDLFF